MRERMPIQPEGGSEMRVDTGESTAGSEPPSAPAPTDLATRVDEVVRAFQAHFTAPVDAVAVDALRADVLELAKCHAARTVLETITARESRRAAKRQRRPWGRPQVRP